MNSIKQKAYKVVRITKQGKVSANGNLVDYPEIQVQYDSADLIRPKEKGHNLFVFSSLEAARTFANTTFSRWDSYEIWEVTAYGCQLPPQRLVRLQNAHYKGMSAIELWHQFWFGQQAGEMTFETPKDTWVCKALKMVKKVD